MAVKKESGKKTRVTEPTAAVFPVCSPTAAASSRNPVPSSTVAPTRAASAPGPATGVAPSSTPSPVSAAAWAVRTAIPASTGAASSAQRGTG